MEFRVNFFCALQLAPSLELARTSAGVAGLLELKHHAALALPYGLNYPCLRAEVFYGPTEYGS
jgi:hypothetical protein